MTGTLAAIVARVAARLAERRTRVPLRELTARLADQPAARALGEALRRAPAAGPTAARGPLRVMAELKRSSPSQGPIAPGLDAAAAARELAAAGCAALSVLTEPDFFGGSLEGLAAVRAAVALPLLRKDFLLDVYQVVEARAYGADAVLLLAAVLEDARLTALRDRAGELGMAVVAEAHGPRELERLLRLDFPIVGVNARNLDDLSVDLEASLRDLATVPADRVAVAESGISSADDARRVAASRADAVLVGTALMQGGTPGERMRALFCI